MSKPRRSPWLALVSMFLLVLNVSAWLWATTIGKGFEVPCHIGHSLNAEDYVGLYGGHFAWRRFTHHPGSDLSWVPAFHTVNLTWLGNGYVQLPTYATGTNGVKWNADLRCFAIHCWLVTLLTAILPVRCLIHILRHRKDTQERLCQKCGYDLRAHPPGTKCPECGTPEPSA
jgi:hypothetical protein